MEICVIPLPVVIEVDQYWTCPYGITLSICQVKSARTHLLLFSSVETACLVSYLVCSGITMEFRPAYCKDVLNYSLESVVYLI